MAVRAINRPIYEYTCDLCGTIERAEWIPSNWEGMSIALYSGSMSQLHICQDCITGNSILFLINKVTANIPANAGVENES